MLRLCSRLIYLLIIVSLFVSCKKEEFTRQIGIECYFKVLPDTSHINIGDTISFIAWVPYNSRAGNSLIDVSNMEVDIWNVFNFTGIDTTTTATPGPNYAYRFENYFTRRMIAGEFLNYQQNLFIKNLVKNDTCFYFEMQLIAFKKWVYFVRPASGCYGYLNNRKWRVHIIPQFLNKKLNQFLLQEWRPGISPWNSDYFFKTY